MGRGTYKYICEDCKAENWLGSRDRSSRSKPRCVECGSPWLIPSKRSYASDKIAESIDASHGQRAIRDKKMNIDRSRGKNVC